MSVVMLLSLISVIRPAAASDVGCAGLAPGATLDGDGPLCEDGAPGPVSVNYPAQPGWPAQVQGVASPPVTADLDPSVDGLEVVVGTLSTGTNLYAFYADGTPMAGFPVDIGGFIAASPSIGDIDGDGDLEIVAGGFLSTNITAVNHDGTVVPGWPVVVGDAVRSTAALGQLDPSTPGLEVVVGVQDGSVLALYGDGTSVPGWPAQAGSFVERSAPALADVDDDGLPEVFVASWQPGGVYGFDTDGSLLPGWPRATGRTIGASPSVGDLDNDGELEIVATTWEANARVFAWEADGTLEPGWPVVVPNGTASWSGTVGSAALADLDRDGMLEVVVGTNDDCGTLHAWHFDGTEMAGWPLWIGLALDSSNPVIGDVDGDARPEVVIGAGSGFRPYGCPTYNQSELWIADHDGTAKPGWPVSFSTFAPPNAALDDLDRDADMEIVLALAQKVYAWNAPGHRARRPWPFFGANVRHTNLFLDRRVEL